MSWKDTYKNRITTAEKAIKAVKDNNHVAFPQGASFPLLIGKLLAKCHQDFREGLTNEFIKHKSNS